MLHPRFPFGKPIKFPVEMITIDSTLQTRAGPNEEAVAEYAADMEAGDEFPPAILFSDGATYRLADGFQRYAAVVKLGRKELLVIIREGNRREALLYAVGANAKHGLRRTREDKRRAVLTLLQDDEWRNWSDREVAKHCSVSHTFVATIRREFSGNVASDGASTSLPDFRPDRIYRALTGRGMLEIIPSADPRFLYVAYYRDLDTDGAEAVYLDREVRLLPHVWLALMGVFDCGPVEGWQEEEFNGKEPSYVTELPIVETATAG
jgi:hypothetical protein